MKEARRFPIENNVQGQWRHDYDRYLVRRTHMPDGSYLYMETHPTSNISALSEVEFAWQIYQDKGVGRHIRWQKVYPPSEKDWDEYEKTLEEIAPEIPGVDRKDIRERLQWLSPAFQYESDLRSVWSATTFHHGNWIETLNDSQLPTDPIHLSLAYNPSPDVPLYVEERDVYRYNKLLILREPQTHISAEYNKETGKLSSLTLHPQTEWEKPPQPSENPIASLTALVNSLTSPFDVPDYFQCENDDEVKNDRNPPAPGQRDQARAFLTETIAKAFPQDDEPERIEKVNFLCTKHHVDWALAKKTTPDYSEMLQQLGNMAEEYLHTIEWYGHTMSMKIAELTPTDEGFSWFQKETHVTPGKPYSETPDLPTGQITGDRGTIDFNEGYRMEVEQTENEIHIICKATNRRDKPILWHAVIPQQINAEAIEDMLWDPNAYLPNLKQQNLLTTHFID